MVSKASSATRYFAAAMPVGPAPMIQIFFTSKGGVASMEPMVLDVAELLLAKFCKECREIGGGVVKCWNHV